MRFIESNYVWLVVLLMIVASILIFISKSNSSTKIPEHDGIVETSKIAINEFRFSEPKTSVKIVYYYTHSCKFCEEMNKNLSQLTEKYPNKISFSLNPIYREENDLDFRKAKLTNCFLKRSEGKTKLETALKHKYTISKDSISINSKIVDKSISQCFQSQDVVTHLQRIKKQADNLGIKGVPALIINDEAYLSGLSASELNQIIIREIEDL